MISIQFTRTQDMPDGTVLFSLKRGGQQPYSDLFKDGCDVEDFLLRLNRGLEMMAKKQGEYGESKNAPWIPKPSTLTRPSDHPERPE